MLNKVPSYLLTNALVIAGGLAIPGAAIHVRDGIVQGIRQGRPDGAGAGLPVFDAEGRVAGPALVDMHIHGCGGVDASEGDIAENLVAMAAFLEERGITSFQPATVMREGVLKGFKDAFDRHPGLLRTIPGVYLEGPFIDADRRGGIPLTGVAAFSEGRLDSILGYRSAGRPVVKTMSIAPELAGSDVAARMLKAHGVVPAWGHSGAFADELAGFDACHLTHLCNAMRGIDHKRPGLAILPFLGRNASLTFEVIADGVHIHPAMLEFIFSHPASRNACVISDCMKQGGLGAGESSYLGQAVLCDGRTSRYKESGTLIGSAMLVSETGRDLFGRGLIDRVGFFRIASTNPARVLGLSDRGILAPGKRADIVVCNDDMSVRDVFVSCGGASGV